MRVNLPRPAQRGHSIVSERGSWVSGISAAAVDIWTPLQFLTPARSATFDRYTPCETQCRHRKMLDPWVSPSDSSIAFWSPSVQENDPTPYRQLACSPPRQVSYWCQQQYGLQPQTSRINRDLHPDQRMRHAPSFTASVVGSKGQRAALITKVTTVLAARHDDACQRAGRAG